MWRHPFHIHICIQFIIIYIYDYCFVFNRKKWCHLLNKNVLNIVLTSNHWQFTNKSWLNTVRITGNKIPPTVLDCWTNSAIYSLEQIRWYKIINQLIMAQKCSRKSSNEWWIEDCDCLLWNNRPIYIIYCLLPFGSEIFYQNFGRVTRHRKLFKASIKSIL